MVLALVVPGFLHGNTLLDGRIVALEFDPGIRREVEDVFHRLSVVAVSVPEPQAREISRRT